MKGEAVKEEHLEPSSWSSSCFDTLRASAQWEGVRCGLQAVDHQWKLGILVSWSGRSAALCWH